MTEIDLLFNKLDEYLDYPETMLKVRGEVQRRAFFPGGKGTFDNTDTISDKRIMILGQDFSCETNHQKALNEGDEDFKKNPTWRNMLSILSDSNIFPENCFFTNAIMGIRKGNKETGKSPAFKCPKFIQHCREVFLFQLETQKPKVVFVLGKFTAEFLSTISKDLTCWNRIQNFASIDNAGKQIILNATFDNGFKSNLVLLTHPSFRPSNVHLRKYRGEQGQQAEIRMIQDI